MIYEPLMSFNRRQGNDQSIPPSPVGGLPLPEESLDDMAVVLRDMLRWKAEWKQQYSDKINKRSPGIGMDWTLVGNTVISNEVVGGLD